MKKILFVNACVRQQSRTLSLCRYFLEKFSEKEYEIEEIDLNKEALLPLNRERLLSRDALIEKKDFANERFSLAREFADADIIVFGAPYWDMSIPALLKIYIENIMVDGITFTFGNTGENEHIIKARHMVYISTSGGYVQNHDGGWTYLDDLCDMWVIPYRYKCQCQGLDIIGCDIENALSIAKQDIDIIKDEIERKEI